MYNQTDLLRDSIIDLAYSIRHVSKAHLALERTVEELNLRLKAIAGITLLTVVIALTLVIPLINREEQ
jgi:hypothetical protein